MINFRIGQNNPLEWVTAKGKSIPVEKLTMTHINNILNCYHTGLIPDDYLGGKSKWVRVLNKELKKRNNGKNR